VTSRDGLSREDLVGGIPTPPEKYDFVRLDHHPNYWGKKHVTNHQPGMYAKMQNHIGEPVNERFNNPIIKKAIKVEYEETTSPVRLTSCLQDQLFVK